MKKIINILVGCAISTPALAIVPPNYNDLKTPFKAEVEFGLQINTGNTSTSSVNGRSKLNYDADNVDHEVNLRTYFATDGNKTTANLIQTQYQANWKIEGNDYLLGRVDSSWDKFGSYTRQQIVSIGYGFDIDTQMPGQGLSLEVGPGYRYNRSKSTESETAKSVNEVIIRSAVKYSYELHEYAKLKADISAETGQNNTILNGEISYSSLFFQDWALKVSLLTKYTEIVPIGTQNTDTTTTINLLYSFY